MRIIDISQEVLSCRVYPDDPKPQAERIRSMEQGEVYNLSVFSMCAHNGTHVDAPLHFIKDGAAVDGIPLEAFVGGCFVARHEGDIRAKEAQAILERAKKANACERILIAGNAVVMAEGARIFAEANILLIGNESQTVGPEDAPMEVHLILLGKGVVLLEGIVLSDVAEGRYFLNAAPLNFKGFEGAPCRAYLIEK